MEFHTWLTTVTVTGLTAYGMLLLFFKAGIILLLANTLADQFEFSPAAIRHSIWWIAVVSIGALPVVAHLAPSLSPISVNLSPWIANQEQATLSVSTGEWVSLSWLDIFTTIYLLVVVFRYILLIFSLFGVVWTTCHASRVDDRWQRILKRHTSRAVVIRISEGVHAPVTWGNLHPVILLPTSAGQWSSREAEMIVMHELAHIQRWDWATQLLAQCIAILYWPLPGMRHAIAQLSLEAERACDDRVLRAGSDPADYAGLLLNQARGHVLRATVALGKTSELALRVKHIINIYVDRAGVRRSQYVLLVAAIAFLVPFAMFQVGISYQNYTPLAGWSVVTIRADKFELPPMGNWLYQIEGSETSRPQRPQFDMTPPSVNRTGAAPHSFNVSPDGAAIEPVSVVDGINIHSTDYPGFRLLTAQQPKYPPRARRRGIEGRVVVTFDVDATGRVINPRIESSANAVFHRSVLDAIKQFRYEPYRINGIPVLMQGVQEEFLFKLIDESPPDTTLTDQYSDRPPFDSG